MKKLFALRGAVQCENTKEDICTQVGLMYNELLSKNKLKEDDLVSVIFSVTNDLDAVNPATALRSTGRAGGDMSLFSAQEPMCANSVERIIRVIIHCYLDEGSKPNHVYLNGAQVLRPDRK
ncbi:MAG: chorismate mutase [Treponema sp.]|nr:chorismate mutase [Treponema sp.]MCL2250919.1 chorismate mutase [Treponema sp.]